jgi:rare lipoprotein A
MNPAAMTTAHPSLPFGTLLKVTNQANGKSVVLRVTDRGPYVHGRVLDLSAGAFGKIANRSSGVAKVCYTKV